MKNVLRVCFLLLGTSLSTICRAQEPGMLTGQVKDQKRVALSYGTVSVMRVTDSALVSGTGVELDGSFKLKAPTAGQYYLRVNAVGFATLNTKPFEVNGAGFAKDFGVMQLQQDAKVLKEVAVQGLRPTVVTHPDKMVVSVEGTAMATGSTALEVLTKSPGVWVDQEGNLQLNGKAGVRIMIDGKVSYLTGRQLQTMLQNMPADNIKDLEIITSPSAKYDAQGEAGIININLKKNTLLGMNGSIYGGGQYNDLWGATGGVNLNYKTNRWSFLVNADAAHRPRYRELQMNRIFHEAENTLYFDQNGLEQGKEVTPSIRLGADYELNKNHSVGASLAFSRSKFDNSLESTSFLCYTRMANDLQVQARNVIDNLFTNSAYNLHYVGKLDTLGNTLSADLDYVRITDGGTSFFHNTYDSLANNSPLVYQKLSSENEVAYTIYAAKADYSRPLGKNAKLEAGIKASSVESDNDLQFFSFKADPETGRETKQPDASRTNHFIFKENIYAAYTSFKTSLGKKWSVQAGLRAEQTESDGRSLTTGQTTHRSYLNLFPSAFLQQKVTDNYKLTYNYSRRITRPQYQALNPFQFFLDPFTYGQGNPYLRPQYAHSFQFTQTYKDTYNFTLGYSHTDDFIAEVPEPGEVTVFRRNNVDDFESISALATAPVKVTDKWNISNNFTFAYQTFSLDVQGQRIDNTQFLYMVNSVHNILLPKNLKLEVNSGYQGPAANGLYHFQQMWWVDLGLKRSFLNDKLDLALNATDIFRTRRVAGDANVGKNVTSFNQYGGNQAIRLNVAYRFNKGEKFDIKRRNSVEEVNRV